MYAHWLKCLVSLLVCQFSMNALAQITKTTLGLDGNSLSACSQRVVIGFWCFATLSFHTGQKVTGVRYYEQSPY